MAHTIIAPVTPLQKINGFLSFVDLECYRQKYSRIKLVELDLPRDIQAIELLYEEYWEKRDGFPTFENFYQIYSGGDRTGILENPRAKSIVLFICYAFILGARDDQWSIEDSALKGGTF